MRIALGSDHAGYELKESIAEFLRQKGHAVTDFGTHSKDSVDYPDQAADVAEAVAHGDHDFGILVCWTGIGMSIAANKVPGIRAGLCVTPEQGRLTREHNDANILCLGQSSVSEATALDIVRQFLDTHFEGGRHERRVNKIQALEDRRPAPVG